MIHRIILTSIGFGEYGNQYGTEKRSQYEMINDPIKRVLISTDFSSIWELIGCNRGNSKLPGKPYIFFLECWEIACAATLTSSCLDCTSNKANRGPVSLGLIWFEDQKVGGLFIGNQSSGDQKSGGLFTGTILSHHQKKSKFHSRRMDNPVLI